MFKIFIVFLAMTSFVKAEEKEFISGYFDNMGYPMVDHGKEKKDDKGLLIEFANDLAHELKAKSVNYPFPRKRIERALKDGEIHVVCYWSPQWAEENFSFEWSKPQLNQVEYLVGKSDKGQPPVKLKLLKGKRIAMMLGFKYPSLNELVQSGDVIRIDRNSTEGLFEAVDGGIDYFISSKAEIEGYFSRFPEKRKDYVLAKQPLAVTQTQCAISPKSPWNKSQIDRAITHLENSGKIRKLILKYSLE